MIVDSHSLENESRQEADVCIVGGGLAGIVLAREFIGKALRVVVLESGGWEAEPATQSLARGENIGFPYYSLDTARPRCLGGSSTRWHVPLGGDRVGARLRPLDPIDFEKRDWVPFSGWPFTKSYLDPYYERAQSICRVEPPTFEAADWEDRKARPKLPFLGDEVQTIIYKFVLRDLFADEYPNEVSRAENITTILGANVLEIETNATADRVTRLRVRAMDGPQFHVTAKLFVLAAGGIEIPRLLLLSNAVSRNGLGNDHDLVGRFFMEHPHFWSGVFLPSKPDFLHSIALYDDVHTVDGVAIVGKLALNESVLRREKLLNQNIQFVRRTVADPPFNEPGVASLKELLDASFRGKKVERWGWHAANVLRNPGDVGASLCRKVFGTPQVPGIIFANMMEQVPNPESRVTLGEERDAFGQNRVQLNWKITPKDIRSAIRTQEIIGGELHRAGLGRFFQQLKTEIPPVNTEGGYHHMGTTRMHSDPKQGVVDADCRVHGVGNLFIAGPSVFPTGGYANPVLTVVALTVRLADHVKALMVS
jgi:choline dehydrogenase-like flavoprotein